MPKCKLWQSINNGKVKNLHEHELLQSANHGKASIMAKYKLCIKCGKLSNVPGHLLWQSTNYNNATIMASINYKKAAIMPKRKL